jgi:hypothetical protein
MESSCSKDVYILVRQSILHVLGGYKPTGVLYGNRPYGFQMQIDMVFPLYFETAIERNVAVWATHRPEHINIKITNFCFHEFLPPCVKNSCLGSKAFSPFLASLILFWQLLALAAV